ncbi:MAG: ABC transporter permease [Roseburia sp.]
MSIGKKHWKNRKVMYSKNLRSKKTYPIWLNIVLGLILPVAIIAVWEKVAYEGIINIHLLPAPSTLWKIFLGDVVSNKLWSNLSVSFWRIISGFLIGAALGVVIGFFMGLFTPLNKMLSPITSILRSVPIIALIPLFILLLGIGESSKRTIIAFATFWPVLLNTMGGIQNVDVKLCEVAYTYRIGRLKTIFRVVLPSALPSIFTGIRLGISSSWTSVISAEMFAASKGIGYLITISKDNARVGPMFVYVLVIGAIGLMTDKALIGIQNFYIKKAYGIENR